MINLGHRQSSAPTKYKTKICYELWFAYLTLKIKLRHISILPTWQFTLLNHKDQIVKLAITYIQIYWEGIDGISLGVHRKLNLITFYNTSSQFQLIYETTSIICSTSTLYLNFILNKITNFRLNQIFCKNFDIAKFYEQWSRQSPN